MEVPAAPPPTDQQQQQHTPSLPPDFDLSSLDLTSFGLDMTSYQQHAAHNGGADDAAFSLPSPAQSHGDQQQFQAQQQPGPQAENAGFSAELEMIKAQMREMQQTILRQQQYQHHPAPSQAPAPMHSPNPYDMQRQHAQHQHQNQHQHQHQHQKSQVLEGRGIMTPGPSSEIFAQMHPELVSPIYMPQSGQQGYVPSPAHTQPQDDIDLLFTPFLTPAMTPVSTFSQAPSLTGTPTRGEFFSPLTSPALAPTYHHAPPPLPTDYAGSPHLLATQSPHLLATQSPHLLAHHSPNTLRGASRSTKTSAGKAARPSPLVKPTNPARSAKSRKPSVQLPAAALDGVPGIPQATAAGAGASSASPQSDTSPSPINLDGMNEPASESSPAAAAAMMPPPPVPSTTSAAPAPSTSASAGPSPSIAPVTPASIMNLGARPLPTTSHPQPQPRRNSKTAPAPPASSASASGPGPARSTRAANGTAAAQPKGKGKAVAVASAAATGSAGAAQPFAPFPAPERPGAAGSRANASNVKRSPALRPQPTGQPGASPSLKPILPGGVPSSDLARISLQNQSNYAHILSGRASAVGLNYPPDAHSGLETRRTSHKAAEQKRRDSLKASFDVLRALLPPIVGEDEGSGEGRLDLRPEARGMDGAAANKGVSKVVLLKMGNNYIEVLNERIKRRDSELSKLRSEMRDLRARLGILDEADDDGAGIDLDACEPAMQAQQIALALAAAEATCKPEMSRAPAPTQAVAGNAGRTTRAAAAAVAVQQLQQDVEMEGAE